MKTVLVYPAPSMMDTPSKTQMNKGGASRRLYSFGFYVLSKALPHLLEKRYIYGFGIRACLKSLQAGVNIC